MGRGLELAAAALAALAAAPFLLVLRAAFRRDNPALRGPAAPASPGETEKSTPEEAVAAQPGCATVMIRFTLALVVAMAATVLALAG